MAWCSFYFTSQKYIYIKLKVHFILKFFPVNYKSFFFFWKYFAEVKTKTIILNFKTLSFFKQIHILDQSSSYNEFSTKWI